MSKVMAALGHETREAIVEVLASNGWIMGSRLKELTERELGREVSKGAFWFHLNMLRDSGVVKERKETYEAGSPVYMQLNQQVVRREMERMVKMMGIRLEVEE